MSPHPAHGFGPTAPGDGSSRRAPLSPTSRALPVWLPPCVPRLEGSLRLSDVRTATATRNFIHDIGLLLDRVCGFDLGELPM